MKKTEKFLIWFNFKEPECGDMFTVKCSQRILIAKNLNSENSHLSNSIFFLIQKAINQGNNIAFIF